MNLHTLMKKMSLSSLFSSSSLALIFFLRILARSVCVIAVCFLAARGESVRFLLDVNTPVGVSNYQGEKAVTWIFFNMSHLVRSKCESYQPSSVLHAHTVTYCVAHTQASTHARTHTHTCTHANENLSTAWPCC